MISIKQFTFNVFSENTYVVFDETKEAVIIDPGCMQSNESNELMHYIHQNHLKPVKLLNTHCHIDHVLGNDFVMNTFKLPLHLHQDEIFTYKETKRWTAMFNLPDLIIPESLIFIDENTIIKFGNAELTCLFTPGHSIASISFYNKEAHCLISGDVIFKEGIGRTDLPGGNITTLLQSIQTKIYTLPNETKIYSGHGEPTTVGFEKQHNPYTQSFSA